MMCVPSVKFAMLLSTATPFETAMVPRLLPLTESLKVTVPELTALLLATVAVKVTAVPVVDGFGLPVTVVVVAAPLVNVKLMHQLLMVSVVTLGRVPNNCQVPLGLAPPNWFSSVRAGLPCGAARSTLAGAGCETGMALQTVVEQ